MTNDIREDGAAVMLYDGVLDAACDVLKTDDIYILPSSRHEVLAVPGTFDPQSLLATVAGVNQTQVPPEDVLTTQVYHYAKGQELEVAFADEEMEMWGQSM